MGYIKDMLRALFTNGSNTNPAAASNARIPVLDSNNNVIGSDSINNFASVLGGYATAIPSNSDLDNYTNIGNYFATNTSTARTIANSPTYSAFCMEVRSTNAGHIPSSPSNARLQQRLWVNGGPKEYRRVWNGSSWGTWYEVVMQIVSGS